MPDFEAKAQCVQNISDMEGQDVPETAERDLNALVLVPARDNAPRWSPGERLHHLFEQRCDAFEQQRMTAHLAL